MWHRVNWSREVEDCCFLLRCRRKSLSQQQRAWTIQVFDLTYKMLGSFIKGRRTQHRKYKLIWSIGVPKLRLGWLQVSGPLVDGMQQWLPSRMPGVADVGWGFHVSE